MTALPIASSMVQFSSDYITTNMGSTCSGFVSEPTPASAKTKIIMNSETLDTQQ